MRSLPSVLIVAHFDSLGCLFCPFCENRPMRFLLVAFVTLSLGAGATYAQTGTGGSTPSRGAQGSAEGSAASLVHVNVLPALRLPAVPASCATLSIPSATGPLAAAPHSSSPPQSRQNGHDSAVTECMKMWDSGTHMTKHEWLRTCRRVQTRLDNLNVDAISPKAKIQVR